MITTIAATRVTPLATSMRRDVTGSEGSEENSPDDDADDDVPLASESAVSSATTEPLTHVRGFPPPTSASYLSRMVPIMMLRTAIQPHETWRPVPSTAYVADAKNEMYKPTMGGRVDRAANAIP